jgi:hypothetical protein
MVASSEASIAGQQCGSVSFALPAHNSILYLSFEHRTTHLFGWLPEIPWAVMAFVTPFIAVNRHRTEKADQNYDK